METKFKSACSEFIEAWAQTDQDAAAFSELDSTFKGQLDKILAELGWTGDPLPTLPKE